MGNTRIPIKSFFKQLVLFVFNIFLAYEILPDVQAESAVGVLYRIVVETGKWMFRTVLPE
ncbi:TPA: hypothetical protein ACLAM9_001806 [Neisseria meningitidis]|uniref:hypothetical protein n=1 Tax=Neisseria TaxID=482 RepID=UPI0013DF7730|nr:MULTISPECIES: hypothetical protein [Neisseria]